MLWCDTAGLGIFTVVGIQTASRILPQDNTFFFIFIGVLTGVGDPAPGQHLLFYFHRCINRSRRRCSKRYYGRGNSLYPGKRNLCQRGHCRRNHLRSLQKFHGRGNGDRSGVGGHCNSPVAGRLFSLESPADKINFSRQWAGKDFYSASVDS